MPPDLPNAETLFHDALGIGPNDRAAFLTGACGSDATLRRRVEALLAAHEQARGFLPEGTAEGAASLLGETPLTESTGTVIGRYKLLEKLGEGGFGMVWAAEQREPIRRRVALKIIKLGMDTKQVIARFEAERQALALMDHPNIAKVLDAGSTECPLTPALPSGEEGAPHPASGHPLPSDGRGAGGEGTSYLTAGRPYFVMELVRGIPITQYCDEERLTTRDRLDLFIKICHAIQHAHQKGIIHRDIKPSNIMVTLHDGVPVPKVIDFGIAKATQAELTEKTIYTQFQQFIGTPAYMSPEQAEMTGLDIDTRSDIYSLGVLLYELLTGRTPFDGKALLKAGLDEMRRTLREVEPVKPSKVVERESELRVERARARGITDSTLNSQLKSLSTDLDWIVMKCLEKDRARRYETANGLAMDLKRHLNNETIVARPPSTAYRFQKTFRRNKLVFTAATLVVVALVVGLGVSVWQATVANRAREAAETARVAAEEATSLAVQRAATITRNLYFAEMNLAGQAATVPGGIGRVAEVTAKWRPEKEAADQRGWEWYYLRSLIHFDLFTVNGHTNAVLSVAWSPNTQRLASASVDYTIKVWDAGSGTNVLILRGHTNDVRSVAWSPDGKRLASGGRDQTIKLWDTVSGAETMTLRGHTGGLFSVQWSPDGKRLASGSFDKTVKVWDADSGQMIFNLAGHSNRINSVAWSPDGKRLASASADNTLKVWDAAGGQETHTLRGHLPPFTVNSVSWSPDGKRLASGGNDHKVMVWNAETGTNILTLAGHTIHVLSVAWSPDGKRLASASRDNTIKLWDAGSGTETRTLRGHTYDVNSVAWSPDGNRLVSGSTDNTIKIWDVDSEETMTLRGHTDLVRSVAWSPDGKRLVSGSVDDTLRVWDADSRMNILTLRGHTSDVFPVAWSPDGKRLASGGTDSSIKVWDADSGTNIFTLRGHTGGLFSVAWSLDGKRLASSSWDEGTVKIWDAASEQVLHTLSDHTEWVFSVAWSPDGKRLASASADKTVKIWDAVSEQVIHTLSGHTDDARSVAWSPDGKRLASASADRTVKVWDAETGMNILTLRGHTSGVVSVMWSPDGKRLASASFDTTVKVWDAVSGQETLTLLGHTSEVQSVAWSPDGKRLASGSRDNTVRVWDARKAYTFEREQSANPEAKAAAHPAGTLNHE